LPKVIPDPWSPFKEDFSEIEDVKRLKALKPTRTVEVLLDPKRRYGIAEREEWNAVGQRIGCLQYEDWKFYEAANWRFAFKLLPKSMRNLLDLPQQ